MIILPAIDIVDGNCVRLYKGDYGTVEKVADNPLETAKGFEKAGAKYIHLVDLDGAKDGLPKNAPIFTQIAKETNLIVELGGGIRNLDTVEYYVSNGLSRIILGSVAVSNPEIVKTAVKEYGEKIVVGIDAKDRKVACEGWLDVSSVDFVELAKMMTGIGVKHVVFTDISKDGTLEGPNLEQLQEINNAVDANIIASGGINNIEDIRKLKKLNLYGTICGKSLYKGTLDLSEAIKVAE